MTAGRHGGRRPHARGVVGGDMIKVRSRIPAGLGRKWPLDNSTAFSGRQERVGRRLFVRATDEFAGLPLKAAGIE